MNTIFFSIWFLLTFALIYEQMIKLIMGDFEQSPKKTETLPKRESPANKVV